MKSLVTTTMSPGAYEAMSSMRGAAVAPIEEASFLAAPSCPVPGW